MLSRTHLSFFALLFTGLATAAQVQNASDCPGVFSTGTAGGSCCVGGEIAAPYLSVCEGWPICQGPTTTTPTRKQKCSSQVHCATRSLILFRPLPAKPLSCATVIDYSNPDYSSLVQEASSSLEASGTHYQTTFSPVGATAGAGVSSVANTAGAGSPSSTASGAQPTSSSGDAGVAIVQLGVLGGAVLGAAMLL